jgi:para-aminobenzoate synthetase component 1
VLDAGPAGPYRAGAAVSATGRERFEAGVARVLEYLRAGDCYQVNLSHRLSASFEGSPRALFLDLARRARPWMGVYAEWDDGPTRRAVAGVSPEEFLTLGAGATIRTRPMKGTRPDAPGMDADLRQSPKDRAELAMIVDLMRNDLGRVCDLGSVRVGEPRRLERHAGGGVLQATAEVLGRRRADLSTLDLLRATFPGGSVTGAPKVRAMQIIDELEPVRRGLYCGATGYLSRDGRAAFNIAIRTASIQGEPTGAGSLRGVLDYGVGAGIVSDSDPASEWRETLDKARPLARVAPLRVR